MLLTCIVRFCLDALIIIRISFLVVVSDEVGRQFPCLVFERDVLYATVDCKECLDVILLLCWKTLLELVEFVGVETRHDLDKRLLKFEAVFQAFSALNALVISADWYLHTLHC